MLELRGDLKASNMFIIVPKNTSEGWVHSKLCSITHVATKLHMVLRSFVVLAWMCDTIELV
jgi:hypothetical protein